MVTVNLCSQQRFPRHPAALCFINSLISIFSIKEYSFVSFTAAAGIQSRMSNVFLTDSATLAYKLYIHY